MDAKITKHLGQFAKGAHFAQDSVESTSLKRLICMQNYITKLNYKLNYKTHSVLAEVESPVTEFIPQWV